MNAQILQFPSPSLPPSDQDVVSFANAAKEILKKLQNKNNKRTLEWGDVVRGLNNFINLLNQKNISGAVQAFDSTLAAILVAGNSTGVRGNQGYDEVEILFTNGVPLWLKPENPPAPKLSFGS